jgi:hypothetical protein
MNNNMKKLNEAAAAHREAKKEWFDFWLKKKAYVSATFSHSISCGYDELISIKIKIDNDVMIMEETYKHGYRAFFNDRQFAEKNHLWHLLWESFNAMSRMDIRDENDPIIKKFKRKWKDI